VTCVISAIPTSGLTLGVTISAPDTRVCEFEQFVFVVANEGDAE